MTDEDVVRRLLASDPTLFTGESVAHGVGWLRHPERYLGDWLDHVSRLLPRRHERTVLLGMGGSSAAARLFAEGRANASLQVLDSSNPDTVAAVDFHGTNIIASSKSGTTVETQALLAHALAHGLAPEDLVVITDPGTALEELGYSLGAMVFVGDPDSGGRFSGLSPLGLIPALYAGWTVEELRDELASNWLTSELAVRALNHADGVAQSVLDGAAFFSLGADPIASGGALWLEQLIAESTGKHARGFIPVLEGRVQEYRPADMMYWHLVAVLLARHLEVDPFTQPDVQSAKSNVFRLLGAPVAWSGEVADRTAMHEALHASTYVALLAYAPLSSSDELGHLRAHCAALFGPTTANLGPRYLHSTGQLHKGGPSGVAAVQIVQRPLTAPVRVKGRQYTFHDLHMAQAQSDLQAMREVGRPVWQLVVDDLDEAATILGLWT